MGSLLAAIALAILVLPILQKTHSPQELAAPIAAVSEPKSARITGSSIALVSIASLPPKPAKVVAPPRPLVVGQVKRREVKPAKTIDLRPQPQSVRQYVNHSPQRAEHSHALAQARREADEAREDARQSARAAERSLIASEERAAEAAEAAAYAYRQACARQEKESRDSHHQKVRCDFDVPPVPARLSREVIELIQQNEREAKAMLQRYSRLR